jgi:hypothetical protein
MFSCPGIRNIRCDGLTGHKNGRADVVKGGQEIASMPPNTGEYSRYSNDGVWNVTTEQCAVIAG